MTSIVNQSTTTTTTFFDKTLTELGEMESFGLAFCPSTTISHNTLQPKTRSPNLSCRTKTVISQCPRIGPIMSASTTRFSSNIFPISQPDACIKSHDIRTPAAAIADGAGDSSINSIDFTRNFQLGAMFVIWYSLNVCFNIYNKQVLKVYPFPATISAFQFGCGSVIALVMWTFKLHPRPKVHTSQLGAIFLLALGHTVGNLLTNISLGKVAVSFTHTIKAMEPFFAVLLSTLLLGEKPSIWIVSSLVPIVGGVALASFTEASFNWIGFGSAMASNLTNQSRNVYSKKVMVKEELDYINLLSIMTMISFLMLLPIAILLEGVKFSPSYFQYAASQGLNVKELCIKALLTGFCFHSYQQVSYNILGMVSPVTHSVGNCVKRVVVIVSSVIFFQTSVSPINATGTAIALAGVFLYSRAKRIKSTSKTA